jgi:hypothetical protein
MMAQEKSVGIAILGIAAVLAIVGLVLMFSMASKSGAFWVSPKIYGGAIKDANYPYLMERKAAGAYGDEYYAQDNPQYMYYERGVRQIPSIQTACGKGFKRVSYREMMASKSLGHGCSAHPASGYCCEIVSRI